VGKDKTTTMKSLDQLEHQLNPLSVKEAAMIYGDSPSNFYRMVRRGEVPGVFRKKGTPKARIKICPREFVPWLRAQFAAFAALTMALFRPNPMEIGWRHLSKTTSQIHHGGKSITVVRKTEGRVMSPKAQSVQRIGLALSAQHRVSVPLI
jgi:hypothetical protein